MYKNILILPDGTELRSGTNVKNAIRSVKLTEMVNSGKELTIGSCCSDMLEASIFAPGGALEITAGDEIELWKESEDGQRIKMGIYTVEAPTYPTANTMKVVGYDHTAKLDKDLTTWLYSLTEWPYSVNKFAAMVCEACGLTFVPANGFPNEDLQIRKWGKSGVTGRQIMRWLGEIACRYVHADPEGNIRFGWYEESEKLFTPKGSTYYFAGSFSYENYQVAPVDIVQLRLADSEYGALWPAAEEGDNPYIITGNVILMAYVTEDLLPVLEAIQAELSKITYTPCAVSGVSDPMVRAGSIIHITDRNGRQVTAYVMEKKSSGQRDTYTCTGSHRRDSVSAMNNKPDSVKDAENAMNAAAQMTQLEIFNKLTNNGLDQGIFLKDGKVYINLEYIKVGSFTSKGYAYIEPTQDMATYALLHSMFGGDAYPIPEEFFGIFDFDGDGVVSAEDAAKMVECAMGARSIQENPRAQKDEVRVEIDPSNPEKTICIKHRALQMIDGRLQYAEQEEQYFGVNGTRTNRILGDVTTTGKLYAGNGIDMTGQLMLNGTLFVKEGILVDEIPDYLEEGRIVLKKVKVVV